jgi:hypothetical protein
METSAKENINTDELFLFTMRTYLSKNQFTRRLTALEPHRSTTTVVIQKFNEKDDDSCCLK